ncbi:hypothetical protein [Paenibacillus dendritiformis]|uniref:hypothetical protein n=1 Tax=Paenibacillus dendritiformis TaxID=130049 RepID=UPI001BCF9AB5|nr:hypothetical protein [Paenibacillus dendritiformis]
MTYFQTTTDTIFFGLEAIFSMIEILFILLLFNKVFGEARISRIKLYAAAVVAMLTITCGLRAVLSPIRPAALPPVTVLCSMFFLRCYPPNRQKKVLYIGILLTVSSFWILLYDLIATPIEDKNIWLTLILCHLGFYLLLEHPKNRQRETVVYPFSSLAFTYGHYRSKCGRAKRYGILYFQQGRSLLADRGNSI